jgi:hypothetical protein
MDLQFVNRLGPGFAHKGTPNSMIILIIVSVLAGIAIGLRFKVLSILPVIIVAIVATAMITIAQGDHILTVMAATATSATGVQFGYLCATFAASLRHAPARESAPDASASRNAYRIHQS